MSLTFGQYVAKRRKELGLSQKELSKKIRISPQYLNDIERNRRNPPGEFLRREFAKVLGLSEDFLAYLAEGLPPDVRGLSDDPERVARAFRAFRKELGENYEVDQG